MISMIEGSLCMLGKEGCCDAQVVETWNADLVEAVISDLPLSFKDVLLAEGGVGLLMVGDGWLLEAVRVFMLYPAPSPLDCIFSSSDSTHISRES
jgi:hypothetical protein